MSDHAHALALLAMAEKDLRALGGMADAATFADEIAGFHAQQAAEKALKAWLAERSIAYPFAHDLSLLLGLLEDAGEEVEPFRPLVRLNVFAVRFRYEELGAGAPLGDRSAVATEVAALVHRVREVVGQ